ncbi:6-carboxytetrahydropterin synthase QueD [candidate division WOR-3 bacterium]|nr:6-carboxytetrahydropterin synthase QueD [candidate division WOR-3 bacterium]
MWHISVEAQFSAAHQLKGYPGKCERLHGHNFKVKITVESKKLKPLGFVIDFKELKKILGKVIERFDHRNLNELPEFKTINPTAENIARVIYQSLKPEINPLANGKLREVQVWESDTNSVTYYESE